VPVVGQLPGQSTLNRKWLIQMRWDVAELFVPKAPATAQPCISAKGSRSTSALSSTKPGSHHRNLELSGPSVVPDHSGNLEFGSLQPKHPPFLRFPSASQLEFSPAQYLRTATGKPVCAASYLAWETIFCPPPPCKTDYLVFPFPVLCSFLFTLPTSQLLTLIVQRNSLVCLPHQRDRRAASCWASPGIPDCPRVRL
jgi:hypothetical protein